jgi:hypothetical protein
VSGARHPLARVARRAADEETVKVDRIELPEHEPAAVKRRTS